MALKETRCPECDSAMISRKGKYGVFWGCTRFPLCKGTRDSMGRSKQERENDKHNNDDNNDIDEYRWDRK